MLIQTLNMEDLKREFRNTAAYVELPAAKLWVITVAREYLLNFEGNLDDVDREQNFKLYTRDWRKLPLDGVPDVLPPWVEAALSKHQPVYVFDPIQPRERAFWGKKIEKIVNWFNSQPPPEINWPELTFGEALRRAGGWYREKGLE